MRVSQYVYFTDKTLAFFQCDYLAFNNWCGDAPNKDFVVEIGQNGVHLWDASPSTYHEGMCQANDWSLDARDTVPALQHVLSGTRPSRLPVRVETKAYGYCQEITAKSGKYSLALYGDAPRYNLVWHTEKKPGVMRHEAKIPCDICAALVKRLSEFV